MAVELLDKLDQLWSDPVHGDVKWFRGRREVLEATRRLIRYFDASINRAISGGRSEVGEHRFNDAEQLVTLLDASILHHHESEPYDLTLDVSALQGFVRELNPEMIQEIRGFFNWSFYNLLVRLRDKAGCYDELSKRLQCGDTVISFNYDLLADKALWRAGLWTPRQGYGFLARFQDRPVTSQQKRAISRRSSVCLLKPHGSLNWDWGFFSRNVIVRLGDEQGEAYFDGLELPKRLSGKYVGGTDRSMFLPSFIKPFPAPFLAIWLKAIDAVSTAQEVHVIGFSFRLADSMAALLARRTSPKTKVTIVAGRGGKAVERSLKTLLHKDVAVVDSGMTFEEWLRPKGKPWIELFTGAETRAGSRGGG